MDNLKVVPFNILFGFENSDSTDFNLKPLSSDNVERGLSIYALTYYLSKWNGMCLLDYALGKDSRLRD